MSAAVEISALRMTYSGRVVVADVSLAAEFGAITAVLGPNGAGKTTTLETAEGFRRAQAGSIRVLGRDPLAHHAALAPRVGVMLQSGGTWPSLRAGDMLTHVSRLYANPHPVRSLLDRLRLTSVARTPYRRLSGGEQRKLALACALVGRPEVVFLDEPTTGLDPEARAVVWELLQDLRDSGVCVVLTTHLLDEAQSLADRVVVIHRGRVAASGSIQDLTRPSPRIRFRSRAGLDVGTLRHRLPAGFDATERTPGSYEVLGPVTPELVATVTTWCAELGAMPEELSTAGRSLAEAYFELTAADDAGDVAS